MQRRGLGCRDQGWGDFLSPPSPSSLIFMVNMQHLDLNKGEGALHQGPWVGESQAEVFSGKGKDMKRKPVEGGCANRPHLTFVPAGYTGYSRNSQENLGFLHKLTSCRANFKGWLQRTCHLMNVDYYSLEFTQLYLLVKLDLQLLPLQEHTEVES